MGSRWEPRREATRDCQPISRRAILATVGVGVGAVLAGCSAPEDTETESLQERLEALEAEVAALEASVETERQRADELETSADVDHETIESLETDLAEKRVELDALVAVLEAESDVSDSLRQQVETLEADIADYERRLETWNIWGFSDADLDRLGALASTWTDSVVAIDVVTDDGRWSVGTGWVYDAAVVATNAHVAQPRVLPADGAVNRYDLWTVEGDRYEASMLGYTYGEDDVFDTREDIAFLGLDDASLDRVMDRSDGHALDPDEPLLQIGHPWSVDYWVPSTGPFVEDRDPFFVSNVPGQPGVSGSPVLDLDGAVVGMTWGGQYHRVPQRAVGQAPKPGDGAVMTSFEEAIYGIHSYVERVEAAADALV